MSENKGDLISREGLVSLEKVLSDLKELKDEAVKEPKDEYMVMITAMAETLIKHFERFPTVDAVEVVRCGDCKYFKEPFCVRRDDETHRERINMLTVDFCSYGERKDGGINGKNDPR